MKGADAQAVRPVWLCSHAVWDSRPLRRVVGESKAMQTFGSNDGA